MNTRFQRIVFGWFLPQVFTLGHLLSFSHRLALELKSVSLVHKPVQDGVGQGVVADLCIPLVERELTGDGRRGVAVSGRKLFFRRSVEQSRLLSRRCPAFRPQAGQALAGQVPEDSLDDRRVFDASLS